MPLDYFRITFDKPNATYVPGETVTGRVSFNLTNPKNIKEVRLEARGKAKVHWQETQMVKDKDGREREETIYHTNERRYMDKLIRLVGNNRSDNHTTLAAGQHSYPFYFQLPVNIPCSFEHKYGQIRYNAKATFDRPWRFNQEVRAPFNVVVPYSQHGRTRPIYDEIEREFHNFCCFSAGIMKIRVSSGPTMFVPGGTVELIVNYDARSTSVRITQMHMELVKTLTFYASQTIGTLSSERKHASEVLKRVYRSGFFDITGETSLKFVLPFVSPSNLDDCSIIDVRYQLDLTIHVTGMHSRITRSYVIRL